MTVRVRCRGECSIGAAPVVSPTPTAEEAPMSIRLARALLALLMVAAGLPAVWDSGTARASAPPAPPPIPARYAVVDLGTLPGWGHFPGAIPAALNASGHVVGTVYTP